MTPPLRFHWSLSSVGDPTRRARATTTISGTPIFDEYLEFARQAEDCGIESLLMAFGFSRPDPIAWSVALGRWTDRIKFLVAVRSGITAPTYFVQQINTLSTLIGGRVTINVVAGRVPDEQRYYGDYLDHDERYARTDEFWQICHALWRKDGPVDFSGKYYRVEGAILRTPFEAPGRTRPEIFLGGNSAQADALAVRHADCLLTLPDTPRKMAARVGRIVARGTEVGLLVSLIARPTHHEAVAAAEALISTAGDRSAVIHDETRHRTDSVGYRSLYDRAIRESSWRTPYLWTGAVPHFGPPAIALVGSPDEIAAALAEYHAIGVTQFLFMGYPDLPEMQFFGAEILPRVSALAPAQARRPGPD